MAKEVTYGIFRPTPSDNRPKRGCTTVADRTNAVESQAALLEEEK